MIMLPVQTMKYAGLAPKLLKDTIVSIHDYDGCGSRALGKIRIKCQIGNMIAHRTCYVVEAQTTYNLLLGRPWIHENYVMPSTWRQCFKYIDDDFIVKRQFANKKPL